VEDGTNQCEIEIYPRPDGTIYICGESDDVILPEDFSQIIPKSQSCQKLKMFGGKISSVVENAEIIKEQVCYLPIANRRSGVPMIGRVIEGLYIAAGHSCWGILNAPVTGLAMAELILEGKAKSVDLSSFAV